MRRRRDFDSYLAVELWDIAVFRYRQAASGDRERLSELDRIELHARAAEAGRAASLALELHDRETGRARLHVGPGSIGWGA